jgi:DNA-binding ferritin-like protein
MDYSKISKLKAMTKESSGMGTFCGDLFACANILKIAHLKAKGPGAYAQHVALGDLYDAVSDMADDITESVQGYEGILNISIPATSFMEPLAYIKGERTKMIAAKSKFTSMPDIANKIDELIGHFSKTIYKLENLA